MGNNIRNIITRTFYSVKYQVAMPLPVIIKNINT